MLSCAVAVSYKNVLGGSLKARFFAAQQAPYYGRFGFCLPVLSSHTPQLRVCALTNERLLSFFSQNGHADDMKGLKKGHWCCLPLPLYQKALDCDLDVSLDLDATHESVLLFFQRSFLLRSRYALWNDSPSASEKKEEK